MFTLGTEFGFGIPFSPVKPFAGIDLLFSSISGTYNFQGTSEVSSNERSIQSASRTGLGFSIGAEVGFGKSVTMDLSLRYNLHNLFGKEYASVTDAGRIDAYTSVNDGADPEYSATDSKHPIGNDRTIATIQLQLGILFGF
jgi:opacity protein-like surface antigen